MSATTREQRMIGVVQTARAKRARFSVNAVEGAVVSNPIAKKTTSRSGLSRAIASASSGE